MERRLSRRDAARKLGACAIITSLSMIPRTSGMRTVFVQASTPAAGEASSNPFASLGLQTLDLKIGSNGVVGMPETLTAGRYLLHMEPSAGIPSQDPSQPGGVDWPGIMFIMIPSGMTLDDIARIAATPTPGPPDWYYTTTLPGGVGGRPIRLSRGSSISPPGAISPPTSISPRHRSASRSPATSPRISPSRKRTPPSPSRTTRSRSPTGCSRLATT